MGKEVQDDAVFLPSEPDYAPSASPDQMNDDVQGMDVQSMQADRGENGERAEVFEKNHGILCTRMIRKAKLGNASWSRVVKKDLASQNPIVGSTRRGDE